MRLLDIGKETDFSLAQSDNLIQVFDIFAENVNETVHT
jgi:hypothetical protein